MPGQSLIKASFKRIRRLSNISLNSRSQVVAFKLQNSFATREYPTFEASIKRELMADAWHSYRVPHDSFNQVGKIDIKQLLSVCKYLRKLIVSHKRHEKLTNSIPHLRVVFDHLPSRFSCADRYCLDIRVGGASITKYL